MKRTISSLIIFLCHNVINYILINNWKTKLKKIGAKYRCKILSLGSQCWTIFERGHYSNAGLFLFFFTSLLPYLSFFNTLFILYFNIIDHRSSFQMHPLRAQLVKNSLTCDASCDRFWWTFLGLFWSIESILYTWRSNIFLVGEA